MTYLVYQSGLPLLDQWTCSFCSVVGSDSHKCTASRKTGESKFIINNNSNFSNPSYTDWVSTSYARTNMVVRKSNLWKNWVMNMWISRTLVTSFFSTSLRTSMNHSKCLCDGQIHKKYTFVENNVSLYL